MIEMACWGTRLWNSTTRMSIAAKNGAILAGEKEPWCGLRDGLLQG
jgi:hypothetical protein